MRIMIAVIFALLIMQSASAQRCSSLNASFNGGWKPVSTAPRDGTVVEMLETYGIAPWYDIFKWTKEITVPESFYVDGKGHQVRIPPHKITLINGGWVSQTKQGSSVTEDECLFWRPYSKPTASYIDPTAGAQNSVSYWCAALHRKYNKAKDACE